MSYIHFKFVYKSAYDKVTFDGVNLNLSQLKKLIIEKSKLTQNKQLDYDLEITNADTNEVYRNDADLINKNSRVNVKRIMRSSTAPLRAQPPKITTTTQPPPVLNQSVANNSANTAAESAAISFSNTNQIMQTTQHSVNSITNASISKSEYDSLAPLSLPSKPIVYLPETAKNASPIPENFAQITTEQARADEARQDEKAKLESILFNSMNSSSSSIGNVYSANQMKQDGASGQQLITACSMNMMQQQQMNMRFAGSVNNWPPRMMNMSQIRPQQPQQLRPSYCCTICKKPGHPKSLCPEAGTLPKPEERPKFPSGIPKNKMRVARPDDKFAMLGPDGYVVPEIEYQVAQTVKKDKTPFLTDEEEEEEKRKHLESVANGTNGSEQLNKYPPELKCPFGDHIIKDAVLVPCCGHFICCDECIKKKILNDEYVECPHKDCDQEIGSLESITPYHDIRKRVNEYLNDLKLANQRATNLYNSNNQGNNNLKTGQNSTNDVFLDLLLDDVNNEDTNQDNDNFEYDDLNVIHSKNHTPEEEDGEEDRLSFGTHSPLQDSKISSSEAAFAAALVRKNLNIIDKDAKINDKQEKLSDEMKTIEQNLVSQQQSALLPTPAGVGTFIENKMIQPTHQLNTAPLNTNMRPITHNSIYPIQNDIANMQMQPAVKPYMIQPPRNQQTSMIPPNGNFPPAAMPPSMQQYQQYQNNFNPGFNPKYHNNNANNIRNMGQMQNGPTYHQQRMMMPPQQYMNNQMQQQSNMMMNRQSTIQYPPNYPHHLQQNYNNGSMGVIGGSMSYNVPPGGIPPPGVGNFINNQQIMNNKPIINTPYNGIAPQQPGIIPPQIPPAIISNPSIIPPQTTLKPNVPHSISLPMMSEAEFYSYKERLKKEAEMQHSSNHRRNNRNNKHRRSRSGSRSLTNSRSSRSSRSYSSRSRSRSMYSRSRSNSRSRRAHKKNLTKSRSRTPDRNRHRYTNSSSNLISNKGASSMISKHSNDKYYRSNKNSRDYYRRRSTSRDRRRSNSRTKTSNRGNDYDRYYQQYKQRAQSRSKSRSPGSIPVANAISCHQSKRHNRKSRSRSSSPHNIRLKTNRNNSPSSYDSKYNVNNNGKSVRSNPSSNNLLQTEQTNKPQIVVCSIRPNLSDSLFMDTSTNNVNEKEGSVLSSKSTESSKDKSKKSSSSSKHKHHKSKKKHKSKHRSSSKSSKSSKIKA